MTAIVSCLTAIISTASFLVLWFWVVHRELAAKTDIVNSAASQLVLTAIPSPLEMLQAEA